MTRYDDDWASWPQDGRDSAKTSSMEGWWKGELPRPRRGRRLSSVASPPVTVGRWIAFVSREGRLVLRDHRTGQQAWEADLPHEKYWSARDSSDEFRWALARGHPLPAPAIAGDVVCVRSSQDFVLCGYALDTGRELWTAATRASMKSPPTAADGVVLVGDSLDRCYAFDAANGSSRWAVSLGEGIERPAAAAGGIAYVPAGDGIVHAIDIHRGKVLWPAVTGGHSAGRWTGRGPRRWTRSALIAVSGDTLLAASGSRLLGIDAITGERRWRRRLQSVIDGGLAISGGLFVASGESAIYALAVADGTVRWECQLDGTVGSPSVAGDVIFVASEEPARLYAVSLADGRELWNVELEGRVMGAPLPLHGRVLLPLEGGAIDVWRFDRRSEPSESD